MRGEPVGERLGFELRAQDSNSFIQPALALENVEKDG